MAIDRGSTWERKRDGVRVVVEFVGGGAHTWIDVKRIDTGRGFSISASGLTTKYREVGG